MPHTASGRQCQHGHDKNRHIDGPGYESRRERSPSQSDRQPRYQDRHRRSKITKSTSQVVAQQEPMKQDCQDNKAYDECACLSGIQLR